MVSWNWSQFVPGLRIQPTLRDHHLSAARNGIFCEQSFPRRVIILEKDKNNQNDIPPFNFIQVYVASDRTFPVKYADFLHLLPEEAHKIY